MLEDAQLVADPPVSTGLRVGEQVAIARRGDRVRVGVAEVAEVAEVADHPFRGQPISAPNAVIMAEQAGEVSSALLNLWRPCVAYGLIAALVAVPAVVALNR